jgi:hypothetical protein
MAGETPSQPRNRPGRKWRAWIGEWRLPRAAWVYVLAAAVLLAVSQLLWMWHSWPVRQILNAEHPVAGASL